jgi:hypothetical protein
MTETEARLMAHEAVCAERYAGIEREFRASNARLKRIEQILIGCGAFIIGLLITLVIKTL